MAFVKSVNANITRLNKYLQSGKVAGTAPPASRSATERHPLLRDAIDDFSDRAPTPWASASRRHFAREV
jgi:hypothetical protein